MDEINEYGYTSNSVSVSFDTEINLNGSSDLITVDGQSYLVHRGNPFDVNGATTLTPTENDNYNEKIDNKMENKFECILDNLKEFFGEDNFDITVGSFKCDLIIHFPEILLENEEKQKHKISNLFVRIRIEDGGDIYIHGTRTTCTPAEIEEHYIHSHVDSCTYMAQWGDWCQGDEVNNLRKNYRENPSKETLLPIIIAVDTLSRIESITGGPYHNFEKLYISNINRDWVPDTSSILSFPQEAFLFGTVNNNGNTLIKCTGLDESKIQDFYPSDVKVSNFCVDLNIYTDEDINTAKPVNNMGYGEFYDRNRFIEFKGKRFYAEEAPTPQLELEKRDGFIFPSVLRRSINKINEIISSSQISVWDDLTKIK